ncbi:ABC transporter substrate-binding protein [Brachyspira murdochii]|uniref:Extracellular solute-binding protein family 1 n=2 Tax=Brachyspira murdochii TaxID=84378 RepID=D5U8J8_BRAM5|nr:ABC transporter substrate-binding protein [Brachyspira murdochii]ADG71021.1 extracellular solute-binding protein family 1 [Brachyspira murdochii DSM 12563]PPS22445.1 ABC transporter substrate-binding protein [Brachyspira murdochii]
MKKVILLFLISIIIFASSCSKKEDNQNSLVIYTPATRFFIDRLAEDFKQKNPDINVEIIIAGTAEIIKRIEAEKNDPLGDIFFAANENILKYNSSLFEEYVSTNADNIYDDYRSKEKYITGFMLSPSVLIINTNLIKDIKIEGYADLLNPALKGQIAFNDPTTSSSSFEQLVNMLYAMGEGNPDNGWDYVEKLYANLDGKLLSSSSAVYKGVADSEYAVGLTFESAAANYIHTGSPIEVVYMKEGVLTKAHSMAIIKNAKHLENAKKFVDYVTSYEAQKIINDELFTRAIIKNLEGSEILIPLENINDIKEDEEMVDKNKDAWLEKFKNIVTGS